jgi:hypothetical protein
VDIHNRPVDHSGRQLNLALSFQAAYTAPIIMMSQNRPAARDRSRHFLSIDSHGALSAALKGLLATPKPCRVYVNQAALGDCWRA